MVQGRGNAVVAWNVAGRLMLLAVVAVALVEYAQGTTHNVGGSDGWAAPSLGNSFSSTYLNDWAGTQTFVPGDSLFFEYTQGAHNVEEVTEPAYTACNYTSPLQIWTAGNTTVILNNTGPIYFICGVPGHCTAGQKVAINVTSASASPPSSTTTPPPPSSTTPPPPPSPSGSTISSLPASAAAVVFGALFVACASLFW